MNTWRVYGPNGIIELQEGGRFDACNAARSLDKGIGVIDMNDVAAVVNETDHAIELRYLSDGAHYMAMLKKVLK